MDARERWQALQARLISARAAVDAGDRAAALAEVTAAVEIDPDFLAAQVLRDRILALRPDGAPAAPPAPSAASAPGLPEAYAMFEQRAKRRRVDRRIAAAGVAIARRHLHAAAVALDEVIEIDPHLPELAELTARFDELRRAAATPHRGPWIAAVAVFAGGLFGASWLQDSVPILARQTIAAAPLPAPLTPTVTVAARVEAAGTTAEPERSAVPPGPFDAAPLLLEAHNASSPTEVHLPAVPIDNPLPVAVVPAAHAMAEAPALAPVSTPVPPTVDSVDDNLLVKQVLQRYRTAYEGLDAQSAQAVWPAVNQAALARAFDGLASQTLTFDACDVRLLGEVATATCHGSARYVTKVGSRDPRVEPRVWSFTLHKAGSDWTIDKARAER